jgi:hypothetical protein
MKYVLWLLCFSLIQLGAGAQTIINEGKIIYDVYITNNLDEQKGQLIITIKNNKLKREMKMNNGYTNTILFDASTGQSNVYNDMNGNKFAKVVSKADVLLQNQKFAKATYIADAATKMIINKTCNAVNIAYADGNKNTVYYATDYRVGIPEFYSMFPELKGIPMQYEVVTNSNKIVLVAKSVEQIPIDALEIASPTGYKLLKK